MYSFIRQNRLFLSVYILLLIAGVALVATLGKAPIHIFINSRATVFGDFILRYVTHMGDGLFAIAVILLLLFVSIKMSLGQLIAFLSSGLTTQALKKLVFKSMPRPGVFFDGIYELHVAQGVKLAQYNTFPSGHAATTFALFFCLIFTTRNRLLQAVYFFMACLVGFSRVYLSQHFISDVLAGSFIGVAAAIFTVYFVDRWKAQWLDAPLHKHLFSGK